MKPIRNSKGIVIDYGYLRQSSFSKLSNEDLELATEYLTSDTGTFNRVINPLAIFVSMEIQNRANKKLRYLSLAAFTVSIISIVLTVIFNYSTLEKTQKSIVLTQDAIALSQSNNSNNTEWRKKQIDLLEKIKQNTSIEK